MFTMEDSLHLEQEMITRRNNGETQAQATTSTGNSPTRATATSTTAFANSPASLREAQYARERQQQLAESMEAATVTFSPFLAAAPTAAGLGQGMLPVGGVLAGGGASATAASRLQLWNLLRWREEQEMLERRHAFAQHLDHHSLKNSSMAPITLNGHLAPMAAAAMRHDGTQQRVKVEFSESSTFSHRRNASSGGNETTTLPKAKGQGGTKKQSTKAVAKDPTVAGTRAKPKSKKKDEKWLATLDELKAYKTEHGDCIVPRGYAENPRLASWVSFSSF
jgi:Helicase associated domain